MSIFTFKNIMGGGIMSTHSYKKSFIPFVFTNLFSSCFGHDDNHSDNVSAATTTTTTTTTDDDALLLLNHAVTPIVREEQDNKNPIMIIMNKTLPPTITNLDDASTVQTTSTASVSSSSSSSSDDGDESSSNVSPEYASSFSKISDLRAISVNSETDNVPAINIIVESEYLEDDIEVDAINIPEVPTEASIYINNSAWLLRLNDDKDDDDTTSVASSVSFDTTTATATFTSSTTNNDLAMDDLCRLFDNLKISSKEEECQTIKDKGTTATDATTTTATTTVTITTNNNKSKNVQDSVTYISSSTTKESFSSFASPDTAIDGGIPQEHEKENADDVVVDPVSLTVLIETVSLSSSTCSYQQDNDNDLFSLLSKEEEIHAPNKCDNSTLSWENLEGKEGDEAIFVDSDGLDSSLETETSTAFSGIQSYKENKSGIINKEVNKNLQWQWPTQPPLSMEEIFKAFPAFWASPAPSSSSLSRQISNDKADMDWEVPMEIDIVLKDTTNNNNKDYNNGDIFMMDIDEVTMDIDDIDMDL